MTCERLFSIGEANRKELDAPSEIIPACHPKAPVKVYVDSKNKMIVLMCGRCDRLIDFVKADLNYNSKSK